MKEGSCTLQISHPASTYLTSKIHRLSEQTQFASMALVIVPVKKSSNQTFCIPNTSTLQHCTIHSAHRKCGVFEAPYQQPSVLFWQTADWNIARVKFFLHIFTLVIILHCLPQKICKKYSDTNLNTVVNQLGSQ